jgi:DNA polymerase
MEEIASILGATIESEVSFEEFYRYNDLPEPSREPEPEPEPAPDYDQSPPVRISSEIKTLDDVQAWLGNCQRCALCYGRQQRFNETDGGAGHIVFGTGHPDADLMIIGEAPGKNEDETGEPFVGRAGDMLDNMLENVLELPREEVYIANILKCQPPGNRNPYQDEVDCCRPFLEAQIQCIRPKTILVSGSVALKTLFHIPHGITRNRGAWRRYRGIPVMPTFHPAYLLRAQKKQGNQDKRKTYNDLLELKSRYDELNGRRP